VKLEDAFARVPRTQYLPRHQHRFARQDVALDIGYGVTNSQPTTVRNMLRLLGVRPGHRVLDVGSGSAWTTALLAELTGPEGEVVGVERIPEVLAMGRAHLGDRYAWARLHQAKEGVLGWPAAAPYDRILVSAEATEVPADLVAQLGYDGVLVLPVHGEMLRIEKHGRYSFVPLIT